MIGVNSMMETKSQYTYGDIPATIRTREYFPLSKQLWAAYKKLGMYLVEDALPLISTDLIEEIMKVRLDDSIQCCKDIMDGKITNPEDIMAWSIYPPVVPLRGDLSQGTMKLLYGVSADITFFVINDLNLDLFFCLNCHMEDGIPTDWWIVGPDDELLQRKHMKLGYKLIDIPKKAKNLTQAGQYATDILKDIRNERTPQWATTPYSVAMLYLSAIPGFLNEPSVFENIAMLYDGMNAKRVYGMPDYWFCYVPWPSFFSMLFYLSRDDFTKKMCGLSTGGKLVVNHIEDENLDFLKRILPEVYEVGYVDVWKKGLPWPKQTLQSTPPELKKRRRKVYENEEFNWTYPEGKWITPEDLEMDIDEMRLGILFDIDWETETGSVDPKSKIRSKGWGRNAKKGIH